MSSSGTRLTNEFRYLLDMINIASRVGWFRAAAILRRVKGSGSRLTKVPVRQSREIMAPSFCAEGALSGQVLPP